MQPRQADSALVKALSRALRWKRMLESGEFAAITELAAREGIAHSYMTRFLRLILLALDIVEAILDGRHEPEVTLAQVLEPFPRGVGGAVKSLRAYRLKWSFLLGAANGSFKPTSQTLVSGAAIVAKVRKAALDPAFGRGPKAIFAMDGAVPGANAA